MLLVYRPVGKTLTIFQLLQMGDNRYRCWIGRSYRWRKKHYEITNDNSVNDNNIYNSLRTLKKNNIVIDHYNMLAYMHA